MSCMSDMDEEVQHTDCEDCEDVSDARVDTILSMLESDQMDMLRDAFIYMDRDSDGFLSEEDIMLRVKECAETPRFRELQTELPSRFATADQDGDGKLSLTEFLFSYAMGSGVVHAEVINRCIEHVRVRLTDEQILILQENFHYMDANGDGFLDSDELERALRLTLSKRYPDLTAENYHQYVTSVLDTADSDHDGRLSLAEYIRSFQEDQGVLPAMYAEKVSTSPTMLEEAGGTNASGIPECGRVHSDTQAHDTNTNQTGHETHNTSPFVSLDNNSNSDADNIHPDSKGNDFAIDGHGKEFRENDSADKVPRGCVTRRRRRTRAELDAIFDSLDSSHKGHLSSKDLYELLWTCLVGHTTYNNSNDDGQQQQQRRVRDIAVLLLRAVTLDRSSNAPPIPTTQSTSSVTLSALASSSSSAPSGAATFSSSSPVELSAAELDLHDVLTLDVFMRLFMQDMDRLVLTMDPTQEVWARRTCDTLEKMHRSGELAKRVSDSAGVDTLTEVNSTPAASAAPLPFAIEGEVVNYAALRDLLVTLLTPVFPRWCEETIKAVAMAVVYGTGQVSRTRPSRNEDGKSSGDSNHNTANKEHHKSNNKDDEITMIETKETYVQSCRLDREACIDALLSDYLIAPPPPRCAESAMMLAARTPSASRGHRSLLFTPMSQPAATTTEGKGATMNTKNDDAAETKEYTPMHTPDHPPQSSTQPRRRPTIHACTVQLEPIVSLHHRDETPRTSSSASSPAAYVATHSTLPTLPKRSLVATLPHRPSGRSTDVNLMNRATMANATSSTSASTFARPKKMRLTKPVLDRCGQAAAPPAATINRSNLPALTSLTSPMKRRVPMATDPKTVLAPLLSRHTSLTGTKVKGNTAKSQTMPLQRCDCHGAGCALCLEGKAAVVSDAATTTHHRRSGCHSNPLALSESELYELFQTYDTEKVGHLDREWFKTMYANMEQFGVEVLPSELNARFDRYARGSNKIFFNEFCILMLQRVQM